MNEIVDAGHHFFGEISRGLATIVEKKAPPRVLGTRGRGSKVECW